MIVRPGIHEVLVPREVWDSGQRLLPTRTRLAPSAYNRAYPLRGLLRCGHCGVGMKAHRAQGPHGKLYPRYRCERTFKRDWAGCPIKELRAEPIEKWVQTQLDTLRLHPDVLNTILAGVNAAGVNAASSDRVLPLRDKERTIERRIGGRDPDRQPRQRPAVPIGTSAARNSEQPRRRARRRISIRIEKCRRRC